MALSMAERKAVTRQTARRYAKASKHEPLRFVWATLNGPAGKRLAPFMVEIVEALERSGELSLDEEVREIDLVAHDGGHASGGFCQRNRRLLLHHVVARRVQRRAPGARPRDAEDEERDESSAGSDACPTQPPRPVASRQDVLEGSPGCLAEDVLEISCHENSRPTEG